MRRNAILLAGVGVVTAGLLSAGVLFAQGRLPARREAQRPAAALPGGGQAPAAKLVAKTSAATAARMPASIGRNRAAFERPDELIAPAQAAPGGTVVSSGQYAYGVVVRVFAARRRVEISSGATVEGNVVVRDRDGMYSKIRWGGTACPGYSATENDSDRFTQLLVEGKSATVMYDEYDHDSNLATENSLCLVAYALEGF